MRSTTSKTKQKIINKKQQTKSVGHIISSGNVEHCNSRSNLKEHD